MLILIMIKKKEREGEERRQENKGKEKEGRPASPTSPHFPDDKICPRTGSAYGSPETLHPPSPILFLPASACATTLISQR